MDLEGEFRKGYWISEDMKKVWRVQLALLKKLLEVCDKHHLRIWGDGGTMLGTVREHGYIPWDDDIDMVLLRPDYDKLIQVAPSEFSHPYFFQCAYTDNGYMTGHSQLRMDGTSAILPVNFETGAKFHLGIFIDIFPYDAVPDNEDELDGLIKHRSALLQDMCHIAAGWDVLHPFSTLEYLFGKAFLKKRYRDFENIFRAYKIEDNKNVSCLSFQIDLQHFLRDKHWYDETVYLPFEDIQMPLPKEYDKILRLQYGDYMTPRKAPSYHGGFMFLSAERSFQDYLDENRGVVKRIKAKKLYNRIKRILRLSK